VLFVERALPEVIYDAEDGSAHGRPYQGLPVRKREMLRIAHRHGYRARRSAQGRREQNVQFLFRCHKIMDMRLATCLLLVSFVLLAEEAKPPVPKPIPEIDQVKAENLSLRFAAAQREMSDIQRQIGEMGARLCKTLLDMTTENCAVDWNAKQVMAKAEPPKPAAKAAPKAAEKK
jgi:hypothetical protein